MYRVNHYQPPRPPPRPWVPLAIIFGGMTVAMVAGAAFFAYRMGVRRAAVTPVVASSSVSATEASPEPAPLPVPEPTADEAAPAAPGTPAASLRARPPWGELEIGIRGEATQKWAPQHSKPLDVFLQAAPFGGEVEGAFVICRFQSYNKADSFAGDDLHVRATFGAAPEVAQDGPEDANLGFVSAPILTLKRRDSLHFEVFDRDTLTLELITRTTVPFTGAPVVTADSGAAIECRQLTGAPLAHAVTTYGATADAQIATVAKQKLSAAAADWAYPSLIIANAHRATGDVAALTGWSDARAKRRVDAVAAATAKVDAQRPAVFATLHDGAKDRATFAQLEAQVGDVKCDAKTGAACEIALHVTNKGTTPLRFGNFTDTAVYVATAKTGPVTASITPVELAPGATGDAIARTYGPLAGTEPALAGVCVSEGRFLGQRCIAIKLR